MSEFDLGNKGLKITKFTNWADNDKLHKNGKNAFKVFRKLKKQLKAEAFSGKASSLDKYPAEPYVVKLPTDSSWMPKDIVDSPLLLSQNVQEKLKIRMLEDYMEEVKTYRRQDEKIYELVVQQVCSPESLEVMRADPDWKRMLNIHISCV